MVLATVLKYISVLKGTILGYKFEGFGFDIRRYSTIRSDQQANSQGVPAQEDLNGEGTIIRGETSTSGWLALPSHLDSGAPKDHSDLHLRPAWCGGVNNGDEGGCGWQKHVGHAAKGQHNNAAGCRLGAV